MKNYFRIMLGKQSAYAPECLAGGFIGLEDDIKLRRAFRGAEYRVLPIQGEVRVVQGMRIEVSNGEYDYSVTGGGRCRAANPQQSFVTRFE